MSLGVANVAVIDKFVVALAEALRSGPLALGFEAPMFVPVHDDSVNLTRGRLGDNDRAFSAPAGSCVLVTALVIVPYILTKLKGRVHQARATFDWRRPLNAYDVLFFEAFVTHQPKTADPQRHIADARLAIERFREGLKSGGAFESALKEPSSMNLLGAILLRTKWTTDIRVLFDECLVVRQKGPVTKPCV